MELESKQLLVDIMSLIKTGTVVHSSDVYSLLERTQASNILALHYGIRIHPISESLYHEVVEIQKKVTHTAANPGLTDFIPLLRHLPAALSPWKMAADALFAEQTELHMRLLRT